MKDITQMPWKLITFSKQKYLQQIVAVKIDGAMNMRLFDAVELFMQDETWSEREERFAEGGEFANNFVAQFNNYDHLTDELVRCREALDAAETMLRCLPETNTNAKGTKPNMTTSRALALVRAAIVTSQTLNAT